MFTFDILQKREHFSGTLSNQYPCAVNIEDGLAIPFENKDVALRAIDDFNNEIGLPPTGYNSWVPSECFRMDGSPLVGTLDGPVEPEKAVVNILGLDYPVAPQVAQHIAELKKALTAACIERDDVAAKFRASLLDDQSHW